MLYWVARVVTFEQDAHETRSRHHHQGILPSEAESRRPFCSGEAAKVLLNALCLSTLLMVSVIFIGQFRGILISVLRRRPSLMSIRQRHCGDYR